MRVGLAADHAGFELKRRLADCLRGEGYEVKDLGAPRLSPDDDYPDYVLPLAAAVAEGRVDRGIAICGTGAGAAIAANKVAGARAVAAPVHDGSYVRIGVEQEDVNVLCLGARRLDVETAWEIVREFLEAVKNRQDEQTAGCVAE